MPRLRPHANAIERIARVLTLLSLCAALCSAQCQVSFSSPEDHELVSTEALVINFIAVNPSEHGYAIVNATCGDPPRPVFSAQVLQKDLGKLPSPFQVVVPDDSAMSCKGDHLNVTACYYGDAPCQACSSLVLDVSGDGVSIAYVVCSSMSMAGCLVLIFLYIRYPVLRKFPSNLVFWRTVVDLIFSIQFIWINGWEIDNASSPQYCNGGVAFITQFSGAASLGWYLVMALNFYFSVDNPFVRPQTKVAHYHVGVWSASIITGIIASFQYGYRSDFRLCWIKKTSGINLFNWLLYFVWLIIFAVVSIYILWSGSRKLNANTGFAKNLAKTLAKRETALRQTQIYIFVFSFYWTIAAIIWAVVYFISQASDAHEIQQKPLAYFFTIIISVLGLIDVATWLFIQWEPLQKAREQSNQQKSSSDRLDEPADEEFSDISDALRHEFISCTSHGISFTATHPYRPTARPKSLLVPGPESTHAHDGGTGGYVPPGADATKRGGRHSDAYMPVSEDRSAKYVKLLAEEEQVIDLNIKTTEDDSANYKFIAYAPRLFENIRELFKLRSGQEYADSLGGDAREMKKNFSEGASGSFFYRTADDKFMVKTLTETEFQFLLEILPRYQAHFQQFPESLICKFFGLYSIEMYGHREYFAVMGNVLCSPEYPIDEKYDLKGSSVNRHGKSKKKGGNVSVYKDNDIKKYVRISPTDAQRIVRQLEIDSKFMSSINIMDYSLLLGIHNCTESRVPSSHCNGLSAEEKLRRHNPTLADASPARLKSNTSVSALGYPIPADIHGARYGGGYQTPTHWQSSASPPNPAPVPQDLPAPVPLQRVGADGVAPERQPLLESAGDDCKRPDYESNRFNSSVLSRQASPSSASEVSVITDSFPSVMAASVIVGPGIYHMGIIDMLQQWDWKKKLELYTKIILQCHCRDWQWISAVEPSLYQERFIRKMKKVFNIAQDPQHKEQGLL